MRYIELFAGVGGFRNGLEACNIESTYISKESEQEERTLGGQRAADERGVLLRPGDESSFRCVYANEWDKYTASIYRRHYGEIDTRDITTVRDIPDHDLLTAGFPCQDFSIAGKRAGLDGTRGTLFYEIARILKSKRPGHFLLENVKGLFSHQEGETFQTILGVLSDLGYRVEWMVLNSKYFGVPQNRERVFIVGHLRGRCTGEVFPIIGSGNKIDEGNTETATVRSITAGGNSGGHHSGMTILREITEGQNQGQRIYDADGLAKTLAGEAGGQGAKTGLYAMRGRENGQQLEFQGDETNTITSVAKDNLWLENARIRRLTPVECARLQGFPDNWAEYGMLEDGTIVKISNTQRYKVMGNAVTTNVITAIGTPLVKHINQ